MLPVRRFMKNLEDEVSRQSGIPISDLTVDMIAGKSLILFLLSLW